MLVQGILPLYESIMSVFPFITLQNFLDGQIKYLHLWDWQHLCWFYISDGGIFCKNKVIECFSTWRDLRSICIFIFFTSLHFWHHLTMLTPASRGLSVDVVVLRDGDIFVCDFCGTREQLAKIAVANRNKKFLHIVKDWNFNHFSLLHFSYSVSSVVWWIFSSSRWCQIIVSLISFSFTHCSRTICAVRAFSVVESDHIWIWWISTIPSISWSSSVISSISIFIGTPSKSSFGYFVSKD